MNQIKPEEAISNPSSHSIILKEIPDFPGYYASNQGDIYRDENPFVRVRESIHPQGYRRITIKGKSCYVHHLICAAFVGPRGIDEKGRKQVIRHLGEITDCRPEMLVYGTQLENLDDARKQGRLKTGSRHWLAKLTEEDVDRIRIMVKYGRYSYAEIGRMFGVWPHVIQAIFYGRSFRYHPEWF